MQKRHRTKWELAAVTASALFFTTCVTAAGMAQSVSRKMQEATETKYMTETMSVSDGENHADVQTEEVTIKNNRFGAKDEEILLRIAMAEAEGEPTEGKALVMLVVLNRVKSDDFPDTIEDVVFQKNQFSPTADGGRYWTTEPDSECYEALELVESGWDESRGALYFEACIEKCWQSENCEYMFTYGGHNFYK